MKKNVIITGAAGHLAGVIIRKLNLRGCLIRGLLLPGEEGPHLDNTEYVLGDVTAPDSLDPLFSGLDPAETSVIHTAGIITIQEQVSPAVRRVNVDGTRNVIAKCRQYAVSRLVYLSSVHAIPEPEDGSVIRETADFCADRVEGAYAKTKAIATGEVLEAGKKGMDVVVVHPSGILGPYDKGRNHIVQLLQMYLRRKLPAVVTGGFDFVDVRDVADGVIAASERGRRGECYILSNRYYTMREMAEYMRAASGRRFSIPCLPRSLVKAASKLFEWAGRLTHTRPIFTEYSLETLGMNGHFCHDKATRELGYNPRDMAETVKDTMNWLMAEGAS